MSQKFYTTGENAAEAGNDWETVLTVPSTDLVNWIALSNEGDFPGFWRLVHPDGSMSESARLPAGAGPTGGRRAGFNIPCPGFSGELQIKSGVIGARVTGIYATAMK